MNAKSVASEIPHTRLRQKSALWLAWVEDGRFSPPVESLVFASRRHVGIGHIGNWNLHNMAFRKLSTPMKHMTRQFLTALGALALAGAVRAAIVVPGANGTDGELNITTNTVIDLSQAPTGQWDNDNTANAGKGVYDPAKWAVVFKYTEVNIAEGVTVTFKNHPSRAPVVWLVSGDVTIVGTLNLNGQDWQPAPNLAEPGPGGGRGGAGTYQRLVGGSAGFGIGGGKNDGYHGWGGSYGSVGSGQSPAYGNISIVPLIGGSGGGGGADPYGGAGGGGALLIACAQEFALSGILSANGGVGVSSQFESPTAGSGSGGAVRIIASNISGGGTLQVLGGVDGRLHRPGGVGRIRLERNATAGSLVVVPEPSLINLSPGSTAMIWPPAGAPEVRVVSIGGGNPPADPRAEFGTVGADVVLPATASTQVLVETKNVEQASQVKIRGTPRSNGNFTEVVATVDSIVSNDPLVIRWKAELPVNVGYSAVQAHVIRP